MPELPEVETVRNGLIEALPLLFFEDVKVNVGKLRYAIPVTRLENEIPGHSIRDVQRRGKYLAFFLSNGCALLLHLGMSGSLLLQSADTPPGKHDHIVFKLKGELQLNFRDPRRFGMVDLFPADRWTDHPRLADLGPEPLSPEFSTDYCLKKGARSKKAIKLLLMDARFVAGIGNIYASEILFQASIHPFRPAETVTRTEWTRLVTATREVLEKAIRAGGTTLADEGFKNILSIGGRFQYSLNVYGRENAACPRCGAAIKREKRQGRSSYFCPVCQQN